MGKINSMKITVGSNEAGVIGREAMRHNPDKVFTPEEKKDKGKETKEK